MQSQNVLSISWAESLMWEILSQFAKIFLKVCVAALQVVSGRGGKAGHGKTSREERRGAVNKQC